MLIIKVLLAFTFIIVFILPYSWLIWLLWFRFWFWMVIWWFLFWCCLRTFFRERRGIFTPYDLENNKLYIINFINLGCYKLITILIIFFVRECIYRMFFLKLASFSLLECGRHSCWLLIISNGLVWCDYLECRYLLAFIHYCKLLY